MSGGETTEGRHIFDLDNPDHQKLVPGFMDEMSKYVDIFRAEALLPFVQKHGQIPYKIMQDPKDRFSEPSFSMVMSKFNNPTIDQELLEVLWQTQSSSPASYAPRMNDDRQVAIDLLKPLASMQLLSNGQTAEDLAFEWFYWQSTSMFEYRCHLAFVEYSDIVAYLNKHNAQFSYEPGYQDYVAVVIPDRKMAMTVKLLFV